MCSLAQTEPGKGDLNSLLSLGGHEPLGFAPGGGSEPKGWDRAAGPLPTSRIGSCMGPLCSLFSADTSVCNGFEILWMRFAMNRILSQLFSTGEKSPSSGILGLRISVGVDDIFLLQPTLPRTDQSIPIIPLTILAFHLHLPSYIFIKK